MSVFTLDRPYRTKDGREAWATPTPKPFGPDSRLVYTGYVCTDSGLRLGCAWGANGRASYALDNADDLVNVPEKRVGWIAVFDKGPPFLDAIWPTETAADNYRMTTFPDKSSSVVRIEYEVPGDTASNPEEIVLRRDAATLHGSSITFMKGMFT